MLKYGIGLINHPKGGVKCKITIFEGPCWGLYIENNSLENSLFGRTKVTLKGFKLSVIVHII